VIPGGEYFWLCPKCSDEISLRLGDGAKVNAVQTSRKRSQNIDAMLSVTLDRKEGMLLKSVQSLHSFSMGASSKIRRRSYYDYHYRTPQRSES
jgi:hypothetical protein